MRIRPINFTGGGGSGSLPILNNTQYLQGLSTLAVPLNLIGVSASDAVNIDQSQAAGGVVIGVQAAIPLTSLVAGRMLISYPGLAPRLFYESNANSGADGQIRFRHNRAGAILQNGDGLGQFVFEGFDGAAYQSGASIATAADGVPALGVMPTRMLFSVNNGAALVEAGRINSGGSLRWNFAIQLKGFTVATLPAAPVQGWTAFVTDALLPAYGAVAVGGGAVVLAGF